MIKQFLPISHDLLENIFPFTGLDHMRALVYEHCKKLLENLMLLAAQDNENVARTLLQYRSNITDTLTLIAEDRDIPGAIGLLRKLLS